MPRDALSDINHSQQERLSNIDFRAFFLGEVSRSDLINKFGIQVAAASRDLKLYQELAPDNIYYDPKVRIYKPSTNFKPLFEYPVERALAALTHDFGDDFVNTHKPLIYNDLSAKLNKPDLSDLATITKAIYQNKILNITYHSLSSGQTSREIVPFALVDNGLRWHLRAFDRKRERFSDFVITRIEEPCIIEQSQILEHESKEFDIQWNRIVELEIVPHPSLSFTETIELDYGMENGVMKVNLRATQAGYLLRLWNVDCSTDHSLDGGEYHLWLKNREALYGVDNLMLAPGY
ncbi:WYL domain-containing protein [Mariprofundus ferrooxydans]|uniref:WYL domain-containing protein n=1 Tax=Mariprofundus ferrooxydans TaxID=314344 RepID=UPI00142F60B0|nr:WYL domain-containing protein [Mariprofundus ferrooxydans]